MYSRYSRTPTPQSKPMNSRQVENEAGGYVFPLGKWKHAERFLILGAEGPTFYAGPRKLTRAAARSVVACMEEDPVRLMDLMLDIRENFRAAKLDPVLFALALMARHPQRLPRMVAYNGYNRIVKTGSHQLVTAAMMHELGGWSRGSRNAVARWYTSMNDDQLAYQMLKYQGRVLNKGETQWKQRDVLRLSHARPRTKGQQALFAKIVGKPYCWADLPKQAQQYEHIHGDISDIGDVLEAITQYGLTREMLPTEALRYPIVWDALLGTMPNSKFSMPMEAMIRNLGNMSKYEVLGEKQVNFIIERLTQGDALKESGLHPLKILVAMEQYRQGRGGRGSGVWDVNRDIVSALDNAFYRAHEYVTPSGKRIYMGFDCSGSMDWPQNTLGSCGNITSRVGAAAMGMVTIYSEPNVVDTVGFTMARYSWSVGNSGTQHIVMEPTDKLQTIVQRMKRVRAGGTDCALPMIDATRRNLKVDAFIVYTDNETWGGQVHPMEALKEYRRHSGIKDAKLIVVGMTATNSSIGDKYDENVLDVVGFDTATPKLISDFIAGKV